MHALAHTKLPKDAPIEELWDAAAEHLICIVEWGTESNGPGGWIPSALESGDVYQLQHPTHCVCQGTGGLLREPCRADHNEGECTGERYDERIGLIFNINDCQDRGYVTRKDRDALESAARAMGWSIVIKIYPHWLGDSIRIGSRRAIDRSYEVVQPKEGLRGAHAVLVAMGLTGGWVE